MARLPNDKRLFENLATKGSLKNNFTLPHLISTSSLGEP